MSHEIPENVRRFMNEAAAAYGRHHEDSFSQWLWTLCGEISSPIEQLFMIAINLVAETNFVSVSTATAFNDESDHLLIIPQWQIGKYRTDFALRQHPNDKIVCVELDGHEFHDRNEQQRRYEKARDRFFTASGYSVLHFTGVEVVRDPCATALEAFNLATGLGHVATHPLKDE